MKKIIAGLIAVFALALPNVASAHSGSVTCNATGIVFTYNANFPVATVATEVVNGVTKTFTVTPNAISTDTIPAQGIIPVTGKVTVSSTWSGGGSIPPTTFVCVVTPVTPPPTPPVAPPTPSRPFCPVGESEQSYANGVLTCLITVNPPVPPTPVFTLCPKGDKSLGLIGGVQVCERIKIKVRIVHKVTKIVRWVQWCPLPPHHKPGVAG